MSEAVGTAIGEAAGRKPRGSVLAEYVTDRELAAELGWTISTLRRYRRLGLGPAFIRLGRDIYYKRTAISEWVAGKERKALRRRPGG